MTVFSRWLLLALPAALAAPLFGACGGDGDETGPDDEYVAAFCDARREFSTSYNAAVREVASSGGEDFERIAETFETFAEALDDMKPPEDLQDWHNAASDQLGDTADRISDEGNLEAVTSLDTDPLAGMPDAPRQRLRAAANDEPACAGLNVFEG